MAPFGCLGACLGFELCQKDLRVGLVVIFVAVPIFIVDSGGEGGRIYG